MIFKNKKMVGSYKLYLSLKECKIQNKNVKQFCTFKLWIKITILVYVCSTILEYIGTIEKYLNAFEISRMTENLNMKPMKINGIVKWFIFFGHVIDFPLFLPVIKSIRKSNKIIKIIMQL